MKKVGLVLDSVAEAVALAGTEGVSGGTLYAILMGYGCSYNMFEALMDTLVREGKVKKRGQSYFTE